MNDTIATFTELNRIFIAKGLTLPARLWYLLRHAAIGGPGWMPVEQAIAIAMQFLSKNKAEALLRSGEGLFWTCGGGNLFIHGAWRLAYDLGLTDIGFHMPIPLPVFTRKKRGLKWFRAYLFGSWFVFDRPKMMSRGTVCELFNISVSTYNDWRRLAEKALKVLSVRGNISRLEESVARASGKDEGPHTWLERKDGRLYICWQLPNAFKTTLQRGADIVAENVNRRLTRALGNQGQRVKHCRLFYDNEGKAKLHRARCREHDIFVDRGPHHRRKGLHVWDCYAAA